jgi:hypothetical protein
MLVLISKSGALTSGIYHAKAGTTPSSATIDRTSRPVPERRSDGVRGRLGQRALAQATDCLGILVSIHIRGVARLQ